MIKLSTLKPGDVIFSSPSTTTTTYACVVSRIVKNDGRNYGVVCQTLITKVFDTIEKHDGPLIACYLSLDPYSLDYVSTAWTKVE